MSDDPVIGYQCYICPICYDDHSTEKTEECIEKLKEENAKLKKQNEILKSYLTDYYDEALEKIKQLEREK